MQQTKTPASSRAVSRRVVASTAAITLFGVMWGLVWLTAPATRTAKVPTAAVNSVSVGQPSAPLVGTSGAAVRQVGLVWLTSPEAKTPDRRLKT
jgi:membrane associated rhomboid family serine protease